MVSSAGASAKAEVAGHGPSLFPVSYGAHPIAEEVSVRPFSKMAGRISMPV